MCPFYLMKNFPLHEPTSLPFCHQHPRWCLLSTRESMSLIQRGTGVWRPCQVTTPVLPASSLLHLPSELTTQLNWSPSKICTDRTIFEMPICQPSLAERDCESNDKICGRKSEGWRSAESKEIQSLTGRDIPVT